MRSKTNSEIKLSFRKDRVTIREKEIEAEKEKQIELEKQRLHIESKKQTKKVSLVDLILD